MGGAEQEEAQEENAQHAYHLTLSRVRHDSHGQGGGARTRIPGWAGGGGHSRRGGMGGAALQVCRRAGDIQSLLG